MLESTYFGDRELLLENLTKCLSEVDPRRIEAAKIYGFSFGQPLPEWIEKIEIGHQNDKSANNNQIDSKSVGSESIKIGFSTSGDTITSTNNFTASIQNFSGITTSVSPTKTVRLDSTFTKGISLPEINKSSGEIVYLDNRPLVTRNPRQKEDIKIVLEF